MQTADVTAVIAAFNRERTIEAAVRSVLAQTLSVAECIVVDDGSSDGTAAAVEAIDDRRLRLIRLASNAGISAARNAGIRAATTEWIAFQDSDDEWLPGKLDAQLRKLNAEPSAVACYCGMLILDPSAGQLGRSGVAYYPPVEQARVSGDLSSEILFRSLMSTQTIVARKSVLDALGGFDEQLKSLVDWDLAIRMAQVGPIMFVDEPAVIQRFSANSVTRDKRRRIVSWERIYLKYEALFRSEPKAHALMISRIVSGLNEVGERKSAREWALLALRKKVGSASLLKHALLTLSSRAD